MSGGDDWQPGDLALCVALPNGHFPNPGHFGVVPGGVYTVSKVRNAVWGVALDFEEDWEANDEDAFNATYFRKIRPHVPDEEDAETIRLLTGTPVKEPVA